MDPELLFGAALGITSPWKVEEVEFSKEAKRLDIKISFERGATFACPVCGTVSPAHLHKRKNMETSQFLLVRSVLNGSCATSEVP